MDGTRSYLNGANSTHDILIGEEYRGDLMEARMILMEYRIDALQHGLLGSDDDKSDTSGVPTEEQHEEAD